MPEQPWETPHGTVWSDTPPRPEPAMSPEIYTVRDLIEYLQQFNPESQVYDIDGMTIIPPDQAPRKGW